MITVHYKPLEALRPIHVSILALARTTPSLDLIGETLGVPSMLLDHAADDLVTWQLASVHDHQVKLLERGDRCVAVWASTERRGFWRIENDDFWILGKGEFSFRDPLKSLADANVDPENGMILSEAEATNNLKDYKRAVQRVEIDIQEDAIRAKIIEASVADGNLAETIETSLAAAKSWLHLNRLCRQAEAALADISQEGPHQNKRFTEFKRILQQQQKRAEQSIKRQFRETDRFKKVLLASWLKQRDGFLGEVASSEPFALLIRSDQGDIALLDEAPCEHSIGHKHQVNHDSQPANSSSIFDDVLNFVGSFFR